MKKAGSGFSTTCKREIMKTLGYSRPNYPSYVADSKKIQVKELIEQKYNIARIPFLRETEAYIKLRGLFRFGKLFFSIRRSDEFIDYLNSKGL